MKLSYKLSNAFGATYHKGTLQFSVGGNELLSPIGNKILIFDLSKNKSCSLPFEAEYNITNIEIHPAGSLLLLSTEKSQLYLCSLISSTIIHRKQFHDIGGRITNVKFSPDGNYYAVCGVDRVLVYVTPGIAHSRQGRELSPFRIHKVIKASYDAITCLSWSLNSDLLTFGSKDLTVKIFPVNRQLDSSMKCVVLGGHLDTVIDCYFANNGNDLNLYSLSKNGQLMIWESNFENSDDLLKNFRNCSIQYHKSKKYFLNEYTKSNTQIFVTSSAYNHRLKLLVTGFSNGAFLLYDMPDFNLICSLELSINGSIDSIAINKNGEWIALGSSIGTGNKKEVPESSHSQLIVWEWQSESFILKQSGTGAGLTHVCNCLSYSPDSSIIASGGSDGKIKLWNTFSGFCFVTFSEEHKGPITAIEFLPNKGGKVFLSASLDGTVRAFDLTRYRNFRTLAAPTESKPAQFISLSVDSVSADFVAAGAHNFFEIFLWSLKTGRLLECLTGKIIDYIHSYLFYLFSLT